MLVAKCGRAGFFARGTAAGECDQACRSPWCGHSRAARPTLRCQRSRRGLLRYLQRSSPRCLMEGLSGRGLPLRQALCGRHKLKKQLKLQRATPDPGPDGTANGDSIRPRTREMTHQQRVKGCSKRRCQTAVPTWSRIAKGQTRSRRRCNRQWRQVPNARTVVTIQTACRTAAAQEALGKTCVRTRTTSRVCILNSANTPGTRGSKLARISPRRATPRGM